MTTEKARVYITIDTETSLGGGWKNPGSPPVPLDRTVYGRYGSQFYGIPLIMDILEKFGFRATFFTEVFCSYCLGDEEVGKLLQYIRDRGHDAQLHLHPTYRFYRDFLRGGPRRETDLMAQLSPAEQRELIESRIAQAMKLGDVNRKIQIEIQGKPVKTSWIAILAAAGFVGVIAWKVWHAAH